MKMLIGCFVVFCIATDLDAVYYVFVYFFVYVLLQKVFYLFVFIDESFIEF